MSRIEKRINSSMISIKHARWLFLLVFIIGYTLTMEKFPQNSGEYLIYNILLVLANFILLSQLSRFENYYAAIWLSFIIFIAFYFIRFYWLVIDATPVRVMLGNTAYNNMFHVGAMLTGFKISVLSFYTFSFVAALLLSLSNRIKEKTPTSYKCQTGFQRLSIKILLVIIPPLVIMLAYISHKFHIGEMGADSGEPLPYRLKGIIFYARFIMIPLLILLLINLSQRYERNLIAKIGILFLMFHGVIDMLIRGSRSSILLVALLLLFLIISGGLKLHRKEKIFFLLFTTFGIFMIPVMTEYRALRISESLPVVEAIYTSFFNVGIGGWGTLLSGVEFVAFRIPGIESIIAIVGSGAEQLNTQFNWTYTLDIFKMNNGVAGYLTHNLYNISADSNTLSAPGFIGWLYIVGGIPALLIGNALLALIVITGWIFIGHRNYSCIHIIHTFYLWMLFVALTEGTIDSMFFMVVVGVIVLLGFEIALKQGEKVYNQFMKNKIQFTL